MSLNYLNGGLVDHRVFDTTGNGVINDSDTPVGGYQVGAAIGGTIIILGDDTIHSVGISSLTDGSSLGTGIAQPPGSKGRFSWRELLQ
jgi:type IV pilus assembly protein PilY1